MFKLHQNLSKCHTLLPKLCFIHKKNGFKVWCGLKYEKEPVGGHLNTTNRGARIFHLSKLIRKELVKRSNLRPKLKKTSRSFHFNIFEKHIEH